MNDLTQRQIDILRAVILEYNETGEAVGSEVLEKKYKLGVSPATIRNEMAELSKKGYLTKTHFSSGRIPSAKGYRFYIQNLMKKRELSTFDEVAYKNSIWDERNNRHRLMTHAAKALAQRTGLLSLVATNYGDVYYAGVANLLDKNEFLNLDVSKNLFTLLDETFFWESILKRFVTVEEDVMYILGEEDFHNPVFEPCASVFASFEGGDEIRGIVGVVGPKRMYYEVITPQVEHLSNLIEDIMRESTK
ncbi:MAG: DeoR family transcriptional regulator [Patescibacteria group bacterium]|nr:DeoR family transcriptional regulator [Patescibacteria group bacterium]